MAGDQLPPVPDDEDVFGFERILIGLAVRWRDGDTVGFESGCKAAAPFAPARYGDSLLEKEERVTGVAKGLADRLYPWVTAEAVEASR